MKILLVSQYFYPEPGATTNRLLPIAEAFVQKGHDVTVLCEFPSYPAGAIPKEYRFRLFKKENLEKIKLVRTFVFATARSNIYSRLLNYFSFLISAILVGVFLRRPDIIIVSSPPPTAGLSAAIISLFKFSPLVGDIQDLWPEYAIAVGELRNKYAILLARMVESLFYKRCRAIITISKGLKKYLDDKTKYKKPAYIIFNGTSVPDIPELSSKRAACFSGETITVCYAGVVGLLQPLQDIIEAARITCDDNSIQYFIIGDGVRRQFLEDLYQRYGLQNIKFTGALPQHDTYEALLQCDIGIATLLDIEQFKSALPSKIFDYMALGLPVILGVDGEARQILETYNTGFYYKPGNPADMVNKIKWLQSHPQEAGEMGANGRKVAFESYSRANQSQQLVDLVIRLANRKSLVRPGAPTRPS